MAMKGRYLMMMLPPQPQERPHGRGGESNSHHMLLNPKERTVAGNQDPQKLLKADHKLRLMHQLPHQMVFREKVAKSSTDLLLVNLRWIWSESGSANGWQKHKLLRPRQMINRALG
jgi:hypothetical protein